MKLRPVWVRVHRYTGLAMTVFLMIVGLTGNLLAFYAKLEHAINPQFRLRPTTGKGSVFQLWLPKPSGKLRVIARRQEL